MGQGHSMTMLSSAPVSIDIPELSDLIQDKVLASGRLMKSIRTRSQHGFVLVKAVMKPSTVVDARKYIDQITTERNILAQISNALGYQRIVEIHNAGFLVRQYMFSSVYDRLSTRPFLEDIEKRWLTYQLLCAVRDCHAQNLHHGDIKTENLLVTSWNWLYLTDFSSCMKPTTLPEDNPADFTFYFDTSTRRVCYVAPERFTSAANDYNPTELNWAMDMFSVGCVIAELFLEGPIFTLGQLLKYRTGEYNPEHAQIGKIEDEEIRNMILNMIELDPEKRYSAEQHLSFYKAKIFPDYFYSFLHDYMQDMTEPVTTTSDIVLDPTILIESDRKIERVFNDFEKIAYFLGYRQVASEVHKDGMHSLTRARLRAEDAGMAHINNELHDGTLLFLTLISAAARNTAKTSARLKACDLMTWFASRLPDEAKLDRILPYVVSLLNDKSDAVKVAALHATTTILASVRVVSPINAYLFPEYIFPRFKAFLTNGQAKPSTLVRAAYASCLASLALSSSRMLDMVQAIRADGRVPALSNDALGIDASFQALYDVARAELMPHFEEATIFLITDQEISVRRALLGSISRLCLFFGSAKSSDVILSHLNTYLNEPDWILKCAFYEALVGVATYVGTSSLEQYILPIMLGSMADAEHFVVEKVIRSLARMAALGLFQKRYIWDLVGLVSRYLVHPSFWIRESAAQFVEQSCKFLSTADRYCIVLPILQPFLRAPLLEFDERAILDKLKTPLSRLVFDAAVTWASKRGKSLFWSAATRDGMLNVGQSDSAILATQASKRFPHRIPPSQRDKDDQTALENLRNFGLSPDDEVKLMALREYILKYAQRKGIQDLDDTRLLNNIVSLAQLDITPQNIFFDSVQPYRPAPRKPATPKAVQKEGNKTIADALMDASISQDGTSGPPISQSSTPTAAAMPTIQSEADRPSIDRQDSGKSSNSVDRPNIRIEGLKSEHSKRSSSIGGRHGLLDVDRLATSRRGSRNTKALAASPGPPLRAETMKADAELATTQENVFGKIDRAGTDPTSRKASAITQSLSVAEKSRGRSPVSETSGQVAFSANHSYTGNEPAVLRLLDNHVSHNCAVDLLDFGDAKANKIPDSAIKTANNVTNPVPLMNGQPVQGNKDPWRPAGLLLAQFIEHTAAINAVAVSPDQTFFVTASDDGTCKIWDTSRLEKNVSARSRYTYRQGEDIQVKALTFVEDTSTFVSAASDGSIHAVRVDVRTSDSAEVVKFSKPVLVRDWGIPPLDEANPEHAVWMHHYREQNSSSILLVATSACRILMVDMKNMEIIRTMTNPLHHGIPSSFCIDKKHHWLAIGTSYGILDLWDLRFKLRLKSFGIGGAGMGQRITKLLLHPSRGHGRWIIASCGGEISIWDIEKSTCREVLRPASFNWDSTKKIKNYEPWYPDEESSEAIVKRLGTIDEQKRNGPNVTSIFAFNDYTINASQPENPNKAPLMVSVGEDRTLRYWNIAHVDQSFIVSGPMINIVGEENRTKPRYEISWPTSMSLSGLVQLVEEKLSDTVEDEWAKNTPKKKRTGKQVEEKKVVSKTPRNTLISVAQEQMLKTHMDDITDACLLRRPYGCIISVDKGGAVYVFH